MGNFKMKIEKQIGKRTYEFTVEGSNLHEAVIESKKLSFYDVYKCGCCQSEDLSLDAHVAQGKFKYTTVKCNTCKASVNFGQQQENPDIFYLRTRAKADNSGKEADWKAAPVQEGQAPAPQAQAAQQVQNYTQQPGSNQPRQ
jgi:hypothetical protein